MGSIKSGNTGKTRYQLKGDEPLGKAIGLRLPQSLENKLRNDLQLSSKEINQYIRTAVREKLDREGELNVANN